MQELSRAAFQPRVYRGPQADPVLKKLLAEIASFVALLADYGIEVPVESPAANAAWADLEEASRERILKNFTAYHRDCRNMHNAGISLRDNLSVLSHSLKRANLFANESISGFLKNEHMVEVYNLDNIQIYRSINFFDYCNYSILDLLAREWMALYERLSSITESISREIHESVASKQFRVFKTPAHVMKERDARPSGIFQTDFLYCCPLFNRPGSVAGYLLVLDVAELGLQDESDQRFAFLR